VARTFSGTVGGFDTQGARNRLRRVLAAYAMHDPEVGYVQVRVCVPVLVCVGVPATRVLAYVRSAALRTCTRGCLRNQRRSAAGAFRYRGAVSIAPLSPVSSLASSPAPPPPPPSRVRSGSL
jgi:hypothetical protein